MFNWNCTDVTDELADVLDGLATFVEPLFIVGDLNVHLERHSDPSATQLIDLLADYGLSCRVNEPTHNLGGLLDVFASRDDSRDDSLRQRAARTARQASTSADRHLSAPFVGPVVR